VVPPDVREANEHDVHEIEFRAVLLMVDFLPMVSDVPIDQSIVPTPAARFSITRSFGGQE
jgi:hypothetical protein